MDILLYLLAVTLIISWAIGFFALAAGGIIHVLLLLGVIIIIQKIIQGRKVIK